MGWDGIDWTAFQLTCSSSSSSIRGPLGSAQCLWVSETKEGKTMQQRQPSALGGKGRGGNVPAQ